MFDESLKICQRLEESQLLGVESGKGLGWGGREQKRLIIQHPFLHRQNIKNFRRKERIFLPAYGLKHVFNIQYKHT